MPSDKYTENAVVNNPGWTRIKDGGTTYYRSPDGTEISNHQYYKLLKTYPAGTPIPESELGIASGINTASESLKSKPAFIPGSAAPKQVSHPDPGAQRLAAAQVQVEEPEEEPTSFRDNIREFGSITGIDGKKNPKGTKTDRRYKQPHPRATAQGLGQGIRKLLLLITTLVIAKILNDERAAMTEQEASILGAALGNMLEPTQFNTNYGWLIAETGDYQAILYVAIMYGSRINDIVQEKRARAQQQTANPGNMPPPTAASNGARPQPSQPQQPNGGAYLPMQTGWKTPPGLQNLGGNQ
jgi:hypothetical protein